MNNPLNVSVKVKMNPRARGAIKQSVFEGVRDVFELDIVPEAKRLSPVRKIKAKIKGVWIPGGTNKRSIDCTVTDTPTGTRAMLFTQSGYGGYLEMGTSKMAARPYLYPAFVKFQNRIASMVGARFKRIVTLLR